MDRKTAETLVSRRYQCETLWRTIEIAERMIELLSQEPGKANQETRNILTTEMCIAVLSALDACEEGGKSLIEAKRWVALDRQETAERRETWITQTMEETDEEVAGSVDVLQWKFLRVVDSIRRKMQKGTKAVVVQWPNSSRRKMRILCTDEELAKEVAKAMNRRERLKEKVRNPPPGANTEAVGA